ncbi:hypothetical protein DOTSEDRAFT_35574 [Dothistroma septosporum NZE10]|uniref:Zinc finger PHD-type domain-containing protein n=1 Tax=Dothistroma septosporum (strain NZE10 / CBS 128990) TaxID=675120 RepID=M2YMS4_DOTSN|nr:hypothetical protein DOTSEDRAFT_35574 [Dothistroma septosporum NZE10]
MARPARDASPLAMPSQLEMAPQPRSGWFHTERLVSDARGKASYRPVRMGRNAENLESYDRRTPHMSVLLGRPVAPIPSQPTLGPRARQLEPGTHQRTQQAKRDRMAEMLGEHITKNPDLSDHRNDEGLPEHLLAPHLEHAEAFSAAQKEATREEQRELTRVLQQRSGEIYEFDEEAHEDEFDKVNMGNQFLHQVSDCLSESNSPPENVVPVKAELPHQGRISNEPWAEPDLMSHHLNQLPGPIPTPSKQLNHAAWSRLDQGIEIVPMYAPSSPGRTRRPIVKRATASVDPVPKLTPKSTSPRRKSATTKEAVVSPDQVTLPIASKVSWQKRRATVPTLMPIPSPTKRGARDPFNDEPQKRRKVSVLPLLERHAPVAARGRSAGKASAKDLEHPFLLPAPPGMRSPWPKSETPSITTTPGSEEVLGGRRKSPTLKLRNLDAKRYTAEQAGIEEEQAEAAKALLSLSKTKDTTAVDTATYACICQYHDGDGGDAVQCDNCDSWQHVICFYEDGTSLVDKSHYCTHCKPRFIGELSAIYARQDKIRGLQSVVETVLSAPRRKASPKRRAANPRKRSVKERVRVLDGNSKRKSRKSVNYRDDRESTVEAED